MSESESSSSSGCGCFVMLIPSTLTAMIGNTIHGSLFWCILDFIFWPIAILKWIIYKEITLSALKNTFAWFLNN